MIKPLVILVRYLIKEVMVSLLSLTCLLLFIFMSNQFVRYLNRAAIGQLPIMVLTKLMLIELPNLLILLLPLGFYMALILTFGRLYAEQEMSVLKASGLGEQFLVKISLAIATVLAIIIGILMFWISPWVAQQRASLLHTVGVKTLIQTLVPNRFQSLQKGDAVVYISSVNQKHTEAKGIFMAKKNPQSWQIVYAQSAELLQEKLKKKDIVVLNNGVHYETKPDSLAFQVATFKEYRAELPQPSVSMKDDYRTYKTSKLWPFAGDPKKAAEWHWRLSVPLMVWILALIAVPLSYARPRDGKFARIFPAILIYIVYADFMFVGRDWVVLGKTPMWLGMLWLHGIFLCLALFLFWFRREPS